MRCVYIAVITVFLVKPSYSNTDVVLRYLIFLWLCSAGSPPITYEKGLGLHRCGGGSNLGFCRIPKFDPLSTIET